MTGRHVDCYMIHWATENIVFSRRDYRPEAHNWWQHGHSYVIYTKPHDDGQCESFQPDPPGPNWRVRL
jgi:hypothetical protein